MANNRIIDFQLTDMFGKAILASGGMAQICLNGSPDKTPAVYDSAQVATTNPVALSRGRLYVEVPKSVTIVDIYLATPTGHFLVLKNVVPGDRSAQPYNPLDQKSVWFIPFSHADSTAATEKDTGFDLPSGAQVEPFPGLEVVDIDATETLDVGILSTEASGDADGFIAAASVATIGSVRVSVLNGALTLGALLFVQDSANAGDEAPAPHIVLSTSRSVSYTTSAGSDTCSGFIVLTVNNILNASMQA
jgi:hypothetical protein